MWDLGNRSVVTLVSVLSGCVFLYNVWGPILVVTIFLFLTIYACYSLVINDSLLSPHAFLFFGYCKYIFLEVRASFESIIGHIYRYACTSWEFTSRRFQERFLTSTTMDRRRGSHYQLSADPYPIGRNSPGFSTIAQLSPITRSAQQLSVNNVRSENKLYHDSDHLSYNHSPFVKHTSTPMFPRSKEELENEPVKLLPDQIVSKRIFPNYAQNHTLAQNENTYFGPEESPWGTSISPKASPKINEGKSVQAVGGPLLASNRCNIDPKVYNDVTSPGLTTRLTKYAAEANSKLTHQSQYRVGQFPKVNLHASPVPLIKSVKTRTPVTVRVAPPDAVRYSQKSGKQNILSNLYHTENSCESPLATVDTREVSLKRHASREDVTSDLAKKQRTGSIITDEFEAQDETKQKRSRDESSKSEEDISPQNKTARPTKRTKTPSCFDILNSLSSSKHVISGVKRKANFSRSGTPDFEKHFKSLESVQADKVQALPEVQNVDAKYWCHNAVEKRNVDLRGSSDKINKHSPLKGILKTSNKSPEYHMRDRDVSVISTSAYNGSDRAMEHAVSTESVKLTSKLFMRAEPERNEKLRMLVEEQGNIRAKFTTDDVEEIKREDITDMRQTSMKARLQSMFDAISGKAASKINPDVVIQAEEVNVVKSTPCPVTCATLNSSTTTTNVNTTPISTSAVIPSPGTKESTVKSPKHVAFTLPNKEVSNVPIINSSEAKAEKSPISKPDSTTTTSGIAFTPISSIISLTPSNATPTSSNLSVQSSDFGKPPSTTTVTSTASPGTFTFGAVSSNEKTSVTPSFTTTSTAAGLFGNFTSTTPKSSFVPMTSAPPNTTTAANQNELTNAAPVKTTASSLGAFGANNAAFVSTPANVVTSTVAVTVENKQQNIGTTSFTSNTNITSFKNSAATTSPPTVSLTAPPANTSTSLFTFGNKSDTQPPKSNMFVFGSTGPSSQSTSVFGNPANAQPTSTISIATTTSNATAITTAPSQNSTPSIATSNTFNSIAKTTAATFGSSNTAPSFTFGAATSAAPSTNKPGFSFGSVTSTTNAMTATPSSTTVFGGVNNNPSLNFATPAASAAPQFSSNTSIFGNTVTTTSSIFGTTSSQPTFGAPSTSVTTGSTFASLTPKTTAAPVFGLNTGQAPEATTSANALPVFSSTTGVASTTSTPIFGAVSTSAPPVTVTSGNLFSNASSTTSTPGFAATSNIFGQMKPPNEGFKSVAGGFGSNATPLFGSQSTTTSTFGSTNISSNTTAPSFGSTNIPSNTTAPTFGSANVSSNATVPSFGSPSTTTSAFGAQTNTPFGSRPSMFGSENVSTPVFGSSAGTSPFSPPASGSVFGGQSTAAPTFGTPGSVSAFADNKPSPFGGQTSAFGTPNASAPAPAFGSAPANASSGNTSNIFTFGANQKSPQQSSTFSFGNNNANNAAAASGSAPFQFGATTSKPATAGFNFSAPTTTPSINFGTTSAPTFNASTAGMFNIGSGSTAPRPRNARSRKPR
ncbi:uncharacterized protein LOC143177619 isoform X3 [Calliopsis andreniformis]|uniref:uncharacterized protein LOC143177619 isoform X3 n=1 Tax=Calliopsis andreniformis TaxID=337506 RepID=UPI003FCE43DD